MTTNLIHELYQIGAIKFGEFTLKSGQTSPVYLDIRQIISYPELLRAVADAVWQKIHANHFDMICGVPYTALPIATCLSLQHNIPMVLRRKEKKPYGTKQLIEGKFKPKQICLIIEDVITTGDSILETASDLEQAALSIHDIAVLIDREQGGRENLQRRNYRVHAVFTLKNIIHTLTHSDLLTDQDKEYAHALL